MKTLFSRTSILLPAPGTDMEKWSVIACDQHSSEPEYWEALSRQIAGAPSTLNLMLPEAFLNREIRTESEKINAVMREYLSSGVFTEIQDSYIYVERTLSSGAVRRGLVGALELSAYDYAKGSVSPIRATEGTVEERLPARVAIRKSAPLEMPHVMVFADDRQDLLFSAVEKGECLYDFDLSAGGGHIRGWKVSGAAADRIDAALTALAAEAEERYAGFAPAVLAIGDGNHSLATAKKCGDSRALVELVNINDPAITFEPIHRVLFDTDTADFIARFGSSVAKIPLQENYARLVSETEEFCQEYIRTHGGSIDYIHNDETAVSMGQRKNCAAVLLPPLDKTELFSCIIRNGVFPKKSFSIGHAEDKRYYLECRKTGD